MFNINDLERRWLRYKIKTYLPLVMLGIIGIVGVITLAIYLPSTQEIKESQIHTPIMEPKVLVTPAPRPAKKEVMITIDVPKNTANNQNIYDSQAEPIQPKTKETLVLKPSLHFMDNIEESISPYVEEDDYTLQHTITPQQKRVYTERTTIESPMVVQEEVVVKPKKSMLNITHNNKKNDLKDVIRRFKQNKNPALSLFIAKRYYEDGQYQKSYNYALMTNEIDKSIDESWIIFAKSLVKLGQHELASNTLKSYLKTTKSSAANVLLRKIEAGTFK